VEQAVQRLNARVLNPGLDPLGDPELHGLADFCQQVCSVTRLMHEKKNFDINNH
jgi:hypothetical protein